MKTIENLVNYLALQVQNNPYFIVMIFAFAVIGFVLTLIGFIISFISKKRKLLKYYYQTYEIIKDSIAGIDGLEILYKGKNVNRLSITRIELINSGNEDIVKGDVYNKHDITVYNKNAFDILAVKNMNPDELLNCNPTVTDNGKILLNFDTIRKKERIILDVYHNGTITNKFYVSGLIKKGKIVDPINFLGNGSLVIQFALSLMGVCIGTRGIIDSLYNIIMGTKHITDIISLLTISILVVFMILWICYLFYIYSFRKKAISDPDRYVDPKPRIFTIIIEKLEEIWVKR